MSKPICCVLLKIEGKSNDRKPTCIRRGIIVGLNDNVLPQVPFLLKDIYFKAALPFFFHHSFIHVAELFLLLFHNNIILVVKPEKEHISGGRIQRHIMTIKTPK